MSHGIRRHRWVVLAVVAAAGIGVVAAASARSLAAQAAPADRPRGATYSGKAFDIRPIAPGIYHAVGTGALAVGCNASIVVSDDGVLVVDTNMSPAAAWALREELKAITPAPMRYVVNTHWHWDHAHGNAVYGSDVEVIGHEYTRQRLAAGDSTRGRSWDLFIGGLPARIDELRAKTSAAAAGAERDKLQAQLAVLEAQREATTNLPVVAPGVTLNDQLTLFRGGREIRLLHLGRGHTGGDVVVFLPKERLVITGDLLVEGTSYIGDSFITDWIQTLERLRALDFDTVLPGHGTAFTGKAKIDHFQAYLRDFWAQARALHDAGVPVQDAAARIDMRAHASHYPAITAAGVQWHGAARAYELLENRAE
jgi:glyoxylase-like metal-dependent hydrolase (beta-lactamase superfamily II)